MDMSLSKLWEIVRTGKLGVLQSMESVGHDWVTEEQTTLKKLTGCRKSVTISACHLGSDDKNDILYNVPHS